MTNWSLTPINSVSRTMCLRVSLPVIAETLGRIRETVVTITDSVYLPLQMPQLLGELLKLIVEKARHIKNPIEAAFFMWLNIAYLQPFEGGHKRTSRLCANLPLLLQNCAPLSFLDVQQDDYALAVLGVYEQQNAFTDLLRQELTYLEAFNCARYRLGIPQAERWVQAGRPGI